jgi:hypothetical protein
MKKFLSILSCLLIISFFSSAKEWNISSDAFKSLGTITATTTVDGLTIYAAADKSVIVDESAKSINGMDFTNRLKLGGAGALAAGLPVSRVLTFPVDGPVKISIALQSSSSSADRELCLVSSVSGDTLHIFPAPGAAAAWQEFSYTGGAATLYLLSKSAGINIYYVKAEAEVTTIPVTTSKTIFDPATVDPTTLNSGFEVVTIDGTKYLKVTCAGWGTYTPIPNVSLGNVTKFKCMAKFEAGTSGLAASTVNTFIKLADPSWVEIGAAGAGSSETFKEYTVTVKKPFATVSVLQIAGQSNVDWSAKSGCIIYIGKIEVVDGTVGKLDNNFTYTNAAGTEIVKGGNMEDASAWTFYYNVADAKDTLGTIQFNYTADKPAAGHGGCYRVSTYGQSATFLYQKIRLLPGHTYRWDGAFKNVTNKATNTWLEYGLMKNQPTGGEIATGEFSYVFNLNTWMGKDTLNVDTTFGKYFPFSGATSNTFKLPESETDTEWFIVIKNGCWGAAVGDTATKFDFLYDDISILDLTPNVVRGGNMEDPSAWNFYYNTKDAKDSLGTIEFNYTADKPAAGSGGCYRVSTYGQSATFLWQPITLLPGHRYSWSGAFKNASPGATNTWLEYGIMKNQPTGGEIGTGEFSFVYNLNTWMGKDTLKVDTTFDKYFPLSGGENGIITIPDTVSDNQWFIVIKNGCWGAAVGDTATKFDFLYDDIFLYDVSVVNRGGNMEDASAWKFYYNVADAKDTLGTHEFNYTAKKPAAGKGGCYRVKTYGQSATFTYQPVDVIPGHRYQLTGAFKNALATAPNTWLEFGVMRNEPGGGEVTTGEFYFVYNLNTWMGKDTLNVDTTFPNYFPSNIGADGVFMVPDTVTDTQWWILIKNGCWGAAVGDTATNFEFLYDEIYLVDLGLEPWITLPIEKVVVGKVDSPADFTASVRMKYDADSVYMVFDCVDDVIVNTGTSYQVDNIEVYFDMTNSKNIHYPRNGGWQKAIDDAYDAGDFQLRLVPDVPFATNNKARPSSASIASGYNQVYTKTEKGYQFEMTIAWKALKEDFVAAADKLIGFDVLWSDNDVSASDPNRNQITWNSPTDKPFNDPSLFGVLQLTPSGSFISIPDIDKPTTPSNLVAVATGNNVLLTWDPSTDNRVVQQYIVFDKVTAVDTIYAAKEGNKFEFKDVSNGTHKFGVTAIDVYGNKSAKAQTDNVKVSVEQLSDSKARLYPNPTTGVVNIIANDNKPTKLAVYNVVGELVRSAEFIQSHTLDMSENLKGVYFIYLTSEGNTQVSKLIVK